MKRHLCRNKYGNTALETAHMAIQPTFISIVNSDHLKLIICQLKYMYIKIKLRVRLITVVLYAFIRSIIICMHNK